MCDKVIAYKYLKTKSINCGYIVQKSLLYTYMQHYTFHSLLDSKYTVRRFRVQL